MPAETVIPKRKTVSRTPAKSSVSAAAIEPLITKLYDGTAELLISIPQNRDSGTKTQNSADTPSVQKERIAITLPPADRYADENDRVAALASSLISILLKDIASSKELSRKAVQAEGISRARAEGKQFGRRCLDLDTDLFEELCRAYANNEISPETAGERLGCSYRTFLRRYAQRKHSKIDTAKHMPEQDA
ncbi:MAG TPA: hypothetical protein O0X27_05125 [Methanocorpusculum sp.]|nr:hypothetical protein [Methanocorpusculum sp.]